MKSEKLVRLDKIRDLYTRLLTSSMMNGSVLPAWTSYHALRLVHKFRADLLKETT